MSAPRVAVLLAVIGLGVGLAGAATVVHKTAGKTPLAAQKTAGAAKPVGKPAAESATHKAAMAAAARTQAPAPARRFPDGPGHAIAERSCLACHSAMLVTQQRKDSLGWGKTVSQMEAWSAPLSPGARDTLMVYLQNHFGAPRK